MSDTTERLTELLRSALQGCDVDRQKFVSATKQDWDTLLSTASKHGVEAITQSAVERLGNIVPPTTLIKWSAAAIKTEQNYQFKSSVAAQLTSFYASNGIGTTILKGLGLSMLYSNPALRRFSDLDVWFGSDFALADTLAHEKLGVEVCSEKHHHTTWRYQGVLVENHFDLLNLHDHHSNRPIETVLKRLLNGPKSELRFENGAVATIPCPDFQLLFTMRHAACHFAAERIGLRHLCDVAVIVDRLGDKIDWKGFETVCRKAGMWPFVAAVLGIVVDRLGVSTNCLPKMEQDKAEQELVWGDIVEPRFTQRMPDKGVVSKVLFKIRRYAANSWKHRLVYSENSLHTFFVSAWSHLLKPKSITA